MIIIKTDKEIEVMREGGRILGSILKVLGKEVSPGVTTGHLEQLARRLIKKAGGRPSFLGYKSMMETKAFPTAICVAINHEVVHGPALPSRRLNEGDIVGLDIGMEYPYKEDLRGYYTDTAATFPVGQIDKKAKHLLGVTERALKLAIKKVRPGNTLNDIGLAIQELAEAEGFSVVRDLVGHGVGTAVHEEPQVPNYPIFDKNYDNVVLRPGMVLAIEPMVNMGTHQIRSLSDGFTIVTADGRLSAHFEHSVAVTKKGCEVLTV